MRVALALLFILTTCVPMASVPQGKIWVPGVQVSEYHWPKQGFGHPSESWDVPHDKLLGERPIWFYDWWFDCGRWAEETVVYVPAVMQAWYPQVLACNDGRPLLVLNEPENLLQANLTPAQAAAVLHSAVTSGWRGPIYCCGTQVAHTPYLARVVAAYRAQYGDWPTTGLHVHVYHGAEELRTFVAWARAQNILGTGVVVSEYGWLTDERILPRDLKALTEQVLAVDGVLTAAWFSAKYQPYTTSDLLMADGALTELGEAWR